MTVTVTTRLGKGSPLSWAEEDANFTNLAAAVNGPGTIDASVVNYLATYTGAVATTQAKIDLGLPLDAVAMMGVSTGGGASANTAAIQAAIDTGRRVWLPNGTYNFNPFVLKNGTVIHGESKTGTILKFSATSIKGMSTTNYGVRPDTGAGYTPLTAINLEDFSVDISLMPNAVTFTAGIAGTLLTVTSPPAGSILAVGTPIFVGRTYYGCISSLGTGAGGNGTYTLAGSFTVAPGTVFSVSGFGIAIEDGWDHLIKNVNIIDPLNEASSRWGLVFGRGCYTSEVRQCIIGRNAILSTPGLSGFLNFTTTIAYYGLASWHCKLMGAQDISFYAPIMQKDDHKFECSGATAWVTIIGGDMENGGAFIYTDGGTTGVYSAGNSFGGFTGTMFLGSATNPQTGTYRPGGSVFLDEHYQRAGGAVTLTRSGSIATAQVNTTLVGTVYKYGVPMVGEWVQVTGSVAPFNVSYAQVIASDPVANTFTYPVANSGSTSSSGAFITDNSQGYRYTGMFGGKLYHDPLARRFQFNDRVILQNVMSGGVKYDGLPLNGVNAAGAEVQMLRLNASDQIEVGDGSTNRWILDGPDLRCLMPGHGVKISSPDGLTTKTITINNAGAITLI